MKVLSLWRLLSAIVAVSAIGPTPTRRESDSNSPFVTAQDSHFFVNGKKFNFIGTNAYWLPALNKEEDIDNTLASIAAANFTVVRTWAFNDVEEVPVNGTWFQLIANGTSTINNGPNGLQKLDTVVRLAKKHGIYLLLSLTNNWNPSSNDPGAPAENKASRNVLSNDYGGMDLYVRKLGDVHNHDQFYVNQTILDAFKNYTTHVVSRYANETSVLGWELANDPRCHSTLPAGTNCDTLIVTRWHSTVAQHVKSVDPNHLVSSGNQGFFCADCPKLFPKEVIPPPAPSPKPGSQRRSLAKPISRARLLQERKDVLKERALRKRSAETPNGINIRGRWVASRQTNQGDPNSIGPSFDGSFGVDSEDILNIPQIGFGTFQLFPDQNTYASVDPTLPAFNQSLEAGLEWIRRQGEAGRVSNKPVFMTGFGLVTQANAPFFVPFNSSVVANNTSPSNQGQGTPAQQPIGVTDEQRNEAYSKWAAAAVTGGLRGIVQYQWSQASLAPQPGSPVSPLPNQSGTTPNENTSGVSPNDGYGILGQGLPDVIGSIQTGAAGFDSISQG